MGITIIEKWSDAFLVEQIISSLPIPPNGSAKDHGTNSHTRSEKVYPFLVILVILGGVTPLFCYTGG